MHARTLTHRLNQLVHDRHDTDKRHTTTTTPVIRISTKQFQSGDDAVPFFHAIAQIRI